MRKIEMQHRAVFFRGKLRLPIRIQTEIFLTAEIRDQFPQGCP